MNKKLLISLLTLPLAMSACEGTGLLSSVAPASSEPGQSSIDVSSSEPQSSEVSSDLPSISILSSSEVPSSEASEQSSESSSEGPSQKGHTPEEVADYMENLKKTSVKDHFYYHYYRFKQDEKDYNDWDVWCWPYKPKSGEGFRFDWDGRKQAADHMSAEGNATIDEFGYVVADIDLTQEYDGGWKNAKKTIGGKKTDFYQYDADGNKTNVLDEQIGLQIVKSETRITGSGFWVNDGSNLYVSLADYALENEDGTTSYHCFVTQDGVQDPTGAPPTDNTDPFENDDGENYTYGVASYANVNFKTVAAKQATSPLFLKGNQQSKYLKNGAGVGYQIMVSSFADSDGDGFGDIYGIYKKIDYLKSLGVNVLWLTPIQMSDSYHGYDISDYTQVDPKFGSKASPNTKNGTPTADSAMKDYKDLIAAAHENGMAVIMDLVLNHTSTTNKWFIKSAQLNEEYRGYYQWGNHKKQAKDINMEKYWYPYGSHDYSYYAKFGSSMPELNYAYVSTRDAVATMAKQWCEAGVDGFRMDAVKHIFLDEEVKRDTGDEIISDVSVDYAGYEQDYTSNLTKNLHFWRQLAKDVKKDYPNCFFVGENFDGHAYHVAPYYEGFDSLFDFYSYFNITTLAARSWGVNASTIYGEKKSAHDWIGTASKNTWNLNSILATNNEYRGGGFNVNSSNGYTMINGMFTSNHDIARTINRIAGKGKQGDEGLSSQGNVTTSNFATLDKLATLVQITELMLPGCTWIYYGDEIGMTGNFPNTTYEVKMKSGKIETRQYDKDAPYSDLWYRQPMKWVKDGKVADGKYTTGYEVTGSGMTVGWDAINGSNTMKSVAEQLTTNGSHLKAIQAFATAKGKSAALIRGTINDHGWGGEGSDYIFNFDRQLGNETYRVMVNMSNKGFGLGEFTNYQQVAAFNGASKTSLPAYSAVLLKK